MVDQGQMAQNVPAHATPTGPMMTTMWVDGYSHRIPTAHVVPWMCGVHGTLDTVDFGRITVDVDPAMSDRPGTTYLVEIGGQRRALDRSWVLPWVRGLAVRHSVDASAVCSPDAAERAQCVQALMVGHQQGWLTYIGLAHQQGMQSAGKSET